jgi:tetrahydrodipicolinate N-succinyltransferase
VVIENNVFVGPHCVILPGVRIGEGAVIKAGSVLTKNVPSHVFWGEPGGRPLADVNVPLTPDNDFNEFVKGLRPLNSRDRAKPLE